MKILYLDTETGGLDPKKNPIIQLSGILEITGENIPKIQSKGIPLYREFDFHLRPPLPTPSFPSTIDPAALKVSGLTPEDLLNPDRLEPIDAYRKLKSIFLTYIDRYDKSDKLYLMGQNVHFDYGFLQELWRSQGDDYLGSFIHYHKIDLIALTASLRLAGVFARPLPNMKLSSLCEYFGMGEQEHNSLADIRQTRDIFKRFIDALSSSGISL